VVAAADKVGRIAAVVLVEKTDVKAFFKRLHVGPTVACSVPDCLAAAASVAVRATAEKYRRSAGSDRLPIRLLFINAH